MVYEIRPTLPCTQKRLFAIPGNPREIISLLVPVVGKWAKLGMVLREKVWKSKKMRRWYDVVERKGFNYRGWNMLFEETNSPRYALYFWRYITYSYGIFSIRYS